MHFPRDGLTKRRGELLGTYLPGQVYDVCRPVMPKIAFQRLLGSSKASSWMRNLTICTQVITRNYHDVRRTFNWSIYVVKDDVTCGAIAKRRATLRKARLFLPRNDSIATGTTLPELHEMSTTLWVCRTCLSRTARPTARFSKRSVRFQSTKSTSEAISPALIARARNIALEHQKLTETLANGFDTKAAKKAGEYSGIVNALKDWDKANEVRTRPVTASTPTSTDQLSL